MMTKHELKINKLTSDTIKKITRNKKMFDALINANRGFVDGIVLKYIRKDHRDYDDIMQAGYMAMWKAVKKFDVDRHNASTFSTFAYTVIRNDVLLELKRVNRNNRPLILWSDLSAKNEKGDVMENNMRTLHKQHLDFENQVVNKIAYEQKLKCFSDLERKIIELKQEGHTMKQIAKKLKKNISTLKAVYYVAINKHRAMEAKDARFA